MDLTNKTAAQVAEEARPIIRKWLAELASLRRDRTHMASVCDVKLASEVALECWIPQTMIEEIVRDLGLGKGKLVAVERHALCLSYGAIRMAPLGPSLAWGA